jgi:hypothetical protein
MNTNNVMPVISRKTDKSKAKVVARMSLMVEGGNKYGMDMIFKRDATPLEVAQHIIDVQDMVDATMRKIYSELNNNG